MSSFISINSRFGEISLFRFLELNRSPFRNNLKIQRNRTVWKIGGKGASSFSNDVNDVMVFVSCFSLLVACIIAFNNCFSSKLHLEAWTEFFFLFFHKMCLFFRVGNFIWENPTKQNLTSSNALSTFKYLLFLL